MKRLAFSVLLSLSFILTTGLTAANSAQSKTPVTWSSPYIQYVRGSFGGSLWSDGWLWVSPGQSFRITWKAGDAKWCNKWSEDLKFKGPARFRGEYWTRLYEPNPNSAHGGWVFGLTCGNGATPNAVARIWVKVRK